MKKKQPAGLVSLSGAAIRKVQGIDINKQSWTSPCVSMVRIQVPWENVEPSRGTFDFSIIDAALAMAAENNRPLAVTVGQMGFNAPQWVYDQGVESFNCVSTSDHTGTMPLPWDDVYLKILREFALAFGDHCDAHPFLAYIQMQGFSRAGELYCTNSEPDNTNFIELGCLTKWLPAAKKITRYYMDGFPTTHCFVGLAKPFLYSEGVQAEKDFTIWGNATFPRRFGVMCNSLSCRSNTDFYPDEAVNTYRPSGFQMLCASNDAERLGGPLEAAIDNGIRMGGQFIEVYYTDVQDPAYEIMLTEKNALLCQSSERRP